MTKLQEDIIDIYNTLADFSKDTLLAPVQLPIRVGYSESLNSLTFEQRGRKVSIPVLNYYCKNLKLIKETYLIPADYDLLMGSLTRIIDSGSLLNDRVCISPVKYGFEVFETKPTFQLVKEGPQMIGKVRFISGNSWLFKKLIKLRYERV